MLVGGVGANDSGEFTDTWTWDGTDWTQLVVVPTIDRTSAYEIFDTKKQQLMLFANDDYANGSNQWWLTWP